MGEASGNLRTNAGMSWSTSMVVLTVATLGVCVFLAVPVAQFLRGRSTQPAA